MAEIHKTHKKQRIRKASYGTSDIAALCSVTPATVAKWIDDGNLSAFWTVGRHRRVHEPDLVKFMQRLNIPLPPELHSRHAPHVLIVDDDKEDLELLHYRVSKCIPDAQIHEATSGFHVGHKVATFHPVLVVLDLMMPGVDGFEVCATIRKDPKLKHVKILAVSGVANEKMTQRILETGADDFLSKDSDMNAWAQKLGHLLAKEGIPTYESN